MGEELKINWDELFGNDEVNNMLKKLRLLIELTQLLKEIYIPKSRPFPRKGTVLLCKINS